MWYLIKSLLVILLLTGCHSAPLRPETTYDITARQALYKTSYWSFTGRLAINKQKQSWQANIHWQHQIDKDIIKLSGPLGQGATIIELTDDLVSINRGDGKLQTSTQVEAFINQQLGLFVPVKSLRYWVMGLPDKQLAVNYNALGFYQKNWLVEYNEMQPVNNVAMPRKMTVLNEQVKLKLIVDKWD